MYGENSSKMPLGLAMGLSSDPEAFRAFLKMSNDEQDKIMERARRAVSIIELQGIVNSLTRHSQYEQK